MKKKVLIAAAAVLVLGAGGWGAWKYQAQQAAEAECRKIIDGIRASCQRVCEGSDQSLECIVCRGKVPTMDRCVEHLEFQKQLAKDFGVQ